MLIPIGIVVVIALAAIALIVTARQRATTGRLSRETLARDTSGAPAGAAVAQEDGRARADEARRMITSGGAVPAVAPEGGVARYEPVDEEELGVTRRKFLNRMILATSGLGLSSFGVAALAFLWPSAAGGFGGKINVGSESDIKAAIAKKEPFYNAAAKVYIVAYPEEDLEKAKKIAAYTPPILAGMEQGYVAIYQKCVHLGCRVPWCASSQWFECPCHGSKYNRVGEKQGGPAPRGLDHFPLEVSGGGVTVDTGVIVVGAPIGTNTTGQSPEGAPCV